MHLIMRRLHPRGAANRGICVDAEGAMLGPDCVLVRRTSRGFRSVERSHAAALRKCTLAEGNNPDWLFHQSRRIAEALDKGEVALAQIYGLHIPVSDLDNHRLARIARINFARGYDPDEPRIPKGNPHGGEWATGETSEEETSDGAQRVRSITIADDSGGGDDGESGTGESNASPSSGSGSSASEAPAPSSDQGSSSDALPAGEPPIKFTWPDAPSSDAAPPAQPPSVNDSPATLGTADLGDEEPDAPPTESQPSSQESVETPSASDAGDIPSPPDIPATQPSTTRQVTRFSENWQHGSAAR